MTDNKQQTWKKFFNKKSEMYVSISNSFIATITIKILLETHALIELHSSVWMPKNPIFQANFLKYWTSNKWKAHPWILKKKIGPT